MLTMIIDLLEQFVLAAVEDYTMVPVTNDGPDARFVVLNQETGAAHGAFVHAGATVRVHRGFRLLIERVEGTRLRQLDVVQREWRTM